MTNTELISAQPETLTFKDRQRRIAVCPRPCPACNTLVSQLAASGRPLDEFPVNTLAGEYHCTGCRRRLVYVVPFFGPVYEWRLADPLPPV